MHAVDWVTYRLQNRWKLVEDLTRENHTRRAHRQAGNLQSLGSPSVAGVTEIVHLCGGVEDALGIGPSANALGTSILVNGQIIPQKLR